MTRAEIEQLNQIFQSSFAVSRSGPRKQHKTHFSETRECPGLVNRRANATAGLNSFVLLHQNEAGVSESQE